MENTSVNRRNEAIITTKRGALDMPVISLLRVKRSAARAIAQFNLIVNFFKRNFRKSECQLLIKLFTSLHSTKTSSLYWKHIEFPRFSVVVVTRRTHTDEAPWTVSLLEFFLIYVSFLVFIHSDCLSSPLVTSPPNGESQEKCSAANGERVGWITHLLSFVPSPITISPLLKFKSAQVENKFSTQLSRCMSFWSNSAQIRKRAYFLLISFTNLNQIANHKRT